MAYFYNQDIWGWTNGFGGILFSHQPVYVCRGICIPLFDVTKVTKVAGYCWWSTRFNFKPSFCDHLWRRNHPYPSCFQLYILIMFPPFTSHFQLLILIMLQLVATITLLPNVNIHIIYTCPYNISFYRVPISPFVFVEISIIFTPTSNQSPRNRPSAGCGCGRRWQAQVISLLRWWWACGSCWDPMALLVWAQAGDRKGRWFLRMDILDDSLGSKPS